MRLSQERIEFIEKYASIKRKSYFPPGISTYGSYKTSVHFTENAPRKEGYRTHEESRAQNKPLFDEVCKLLKTNGWKVTADPRILKDYRILSHTHRLAVKGDLVAKIHYYPAGMEVEFYPTYNPDHQAGPDFGFAKYERMTYLDKKRFELIRNKIKTLFASKGALDRTELEFDNPREEVEYRIRSNWHYTDYDIETGDPKISEYNTRDLNKNNLQNSQIKYFFDYNGDIGRGVVYHNINNMWWVVAGGSVRNIASFDLFDYDPAICIRRPRNRSMIRRIERNLAQAVKDQNFERAIHLRDQLKTLVPKESAA